MEIKSSQKGNVLLLEIHGEINISTSPDLKKRFEKNELNRVIINLGHVSYIDSSGLATLVEILKRMRSKGGSLSLTHVSDKVKSLFEITKLDKLFGIYPSDEMALESLK